MPPIISIIIVNYNYGNFIEDAIKSIVDQDCFDLCELIVVDGGSTDNSVMVIEKYSHKITWWVSEKDKGQSDAFNKGFAHARGRLGCWVNADDVLLPGTLSAVIREVDRCPDVEWICGGMIFCDERLKVSKARLGCGFPKWMQGDLNGAACSMVGGPSSFFSLDKLREVGGFNVSLRYTMDGDLWCRFLASGMRLVHLNRYFWGFRMHEASKTTHSIMGDKNEQFNAEDQRLRKMVGWTDSRKQRQETIMRMIRIINGSYFRSVLDTISRRGENVF